MSREEILELHRKGLSVEEIIERLDFTRDWVLRAIRQDGEAPRSKPRKKDSEVLVKYQEVKELRAAGHPIAAIAKQIGVSPGTIARVLKQKEDHLYKPRASPKKKGGIEKEIERAQQIVTEANTLSDSGMSPVLATLVRVMKKEGVERVLVDLRRNRLEVARIERLTLDT